MTPIATSPTGLVHRSRGIPAGPVHRAHCGTVRRRARVVTPDVVGVEALCRTCGAPLLALVTEKRRSA